MVFLQTLLVLLTEKEGKMNKQSVKSSNINSIGYDLETRTLEIEFHSGGVYQYYNVPENIYRGLMNADSYGSYFHKNIKSNYKYKKLK